MPTGSGKLELADQRFGRLLIVREVASPTKHKRWLARCDCGGEALVWTTGLRDGTTTSCGCIKRERRRLQVKHGLASTPEYFAWSCMISRCSNPDSRAYHHYGGRGITVCPEWQDVKRFVADMGPRPTNKHSLDRIDVNGNYEPSNCRWATFLQQMRNRRCMRQVIRGDGAVFPSAPDAAEAVGIDCNRLRVAIRVGRPLAGYTWTYAPLDDGGSATQR